MSIGLVIANIAGSVRDLPAPTANAATGADTSSAAKSASPSAVREPASGSAQLTPGFSLVVLELLNTKGAVTSTIPTTQQLAAYRNGTASPPT